MKITASLTAVRHIAEQRLQRTVVETAREKRDMKCRGYSCEAQQPKGIQRGTFLPFGLRELLVHKRRRFADG